MLWRFSKYFLCSSLKLNNIHKWNDIKVNNYDTIFFFGWTFPLTWLHLPLLAEMVTTKLSIFLTKQLQQLTNWICWERSIAVCAFQLNIQGHVLLLLCLEQDYAETWIISHSHNSAKQNISVWMVTPVILMSPTAIAFCLTFQGRGKQIAMLSIRCLILVLS